MTTTNRRRPSWGTVLAVVLLAAVFTGAQDRGRKVTGVVIDAASGEPVVGARVEYEDHAELSLGVQVTTTDDKGRFEIQGGSGASRRSRPAASGRLAMRGHRPSAWQ
ncbi:MAG: hypothetical protein OXG44_18610 [Gammaproteobacteria bacterium]|nr:hypothetical protein [Gammaproteobacteria bacterium]